MIRNAGGHLNGKPPSGVESKYLLTGASRCGECGGAMSVYSRSHGKQRAFFYACPRAKVERCGNRLEAPMSAADATALAMLTEDVLSPETIDLTVSKLLVKFDAPIENIEARRGA